MGVEGAGTGRELEQALDLHGVARLLVGADQDGLDLVARGGGGLDGAVARDRQRT